MHFPFINKLQAVCTKSKKVQHLTVLDLLAGALGLEPRAYGFGDRRSTN